MNVREEQEIIFDTEGYAGEGNRGRQETSGGTGRQAAAGRKMSGGV